MAMVINTNEQATRIRSVYNQNVSNMNAAMTRLATTRKINSAKDGAANWAISEKMRERMRANDQANQNIQNDTALLKTAQDGLGNTLNILETLKERAINSANDANISTDRLKIQEEVKQLVAQIDDNAAKVKFNGRQLLNGASETASNSKSSSVVTGGVTATEPQGTHSVYSITGLKTWNSATNTYKDVAGTETLNQVTDANGEALFKINDKITVSWRDNGELKQASVTVADPSTDTLAKISGLFTGGVGAASFASASAFTATGTAIPNSVQDGYGNAVNTTDAGLYVVGKDGSHKITDFAISVTRDDGADSDRLANTNAVLSPNAVMQSAGSDLTKGSNVVYAVSTQVGANAAASSLVTGDAGDKTAWIDLKKDVAATSPDGKEYIYKSHESGSSDQSDTEFTMKVNDKTLTFKGKATIEEINSMLKANGVNLRMHIASAGESLSFDDDAVTKGDNTSNIAYKADKAGLHFIAGEDIYKLEITGGTFGSASTANTVAAFSVDHFKLDDLAKTAFQQKLSIDSSFTDGSSSSSIYSNSTSMLPQGEALQFYVGGEQNFGINFSIGKANTQNLLGMSGDSFSSMFKTTDGAEKALGIIENAISKTLVEQTRLGAMEARLGYTSENLTSMNTNLEAANSAYRDADIAKEMNDYMKYSVLAQSSQYMLAQATQNPFSVLQLLQP